jgi:hypothetical protein
MSNFFRKHLVSQPAKPTKNQREICDRLKLKLKPDMSFYDVSQLIEDALKETVEDAYLRKCHDYRQVG